MKEELKTKVEKLVLKLSASNNIQVNLDLLGDLIYKPFLRNKEVAEFFSINVRTLYDWRHQSGLKSKRIRSRHHYMWEDILDFLDRLAQ